MKKRSRITGQIIQVEYDFVLEQSDEECCFSLSKKEVAMLLSQTDYFGWKTRWHSASEAEIDQELITTLKDQLEYKLMSGCCPDEGQMGRYTSDGIYQTSDDGGVTWVDNPEADPRNDWTEAPPLPGTPSSALQCAAADNIRNQFQSWRDQLIPILDAGSIVTAILAGLVGFIGTIVFASVVGTAWGVLLIGLAAALFQAGSLGVAAEITDVKLDTFKCIVFCHMQPDGTFTDANIDDILQGIADEFDGLAETFFYSIVSTMRTTGMNNTATLGAASASDCGGCDCGLSLEPFATFTFANLINEGGGWWRLISDDRPDDTFTMYVQRVGGGSFKIAEIDVLSGSDSPQCVSSNAPAFEDNLGLHCAPWVDSVPDCVTFIGYRALAPFVIRIRVEEC